MAQTVGGAMDSAQLGTTLMHEHVLVLDTEIARKSLTVRIEMYDQPTLVVK